MKLKKKDMEYNPEDAYENFQQRELTQIFQGQSQIFEAMKSLNRKLDEIIGRQERSLSMLSAVQIGGVGGVPHGGQGMPPPAHMDGIRRHEIDALLGNQREMVQASRDIKAFVAEIHQRTGSLLAGQATPQGGGGGQAFQYQTLINEVKDGLNVVKRDIASVNAKTAGPCPAIPEVNCLTPTIFFILMGLQLLVLIGFITYQSSKETQAKKFY